MRVLLIKTSPVVMQNRNLRGNRSPRADHRPWLIRITVCNTGSRRTLQCSPKGKGRPLLAASLRNRDALCFSVCLTWQAFNRTQSSDLTAIRSIHVLKLSKKFSIVLEHINFLI